jgi:hypothetical protein
MDCEQVASCLASSCQQDSAFTEVFLDVPFPSFVDVHFASSFQILEAFPYILAGLLGHCHQASSSKNIKNYPTFQGDPSLQQPSTIVA